MRNKFYAIGEIEITGFARDENSLAISGIDLSFIWGDNEVDGVSTTIFGGEFLKIIWSLMLNC